MGEPPRLTLFETDPCVMLVVVPRGEAFACPRIVAPFKVDAVRTAFFQEGLDVRISQDAAGSPQVRAIVEKRRRDAKAERDQRQKQAEATLATVMRGAVSMEVQQRAEAVLLKQQVDAEIRDLKARIGEAKSNAYTTGVYTPPSRFWEWQARLEAKKTESQALQARIGELKRLEKSANKEEDRIRERMFVKAARRILGEEAWMRVWEAVDEETAKGLEA